MTTLGTTQTSGAALVGTRAGGTLTEAVGPSVGARAVSGRYPHLPVQTSTGAYVAPGAPDPGTSTGVGDGTGVLILDVAPVSAVAGVLTLDTSLANTLVVVLTASVTSIAFVNFPGSGARSERVTVYVEQDAVGGHAVAGWPSAVKWEYGEVPVIPPASNSISCLVFDSVTGGTTILGNIVGLGYS